MQLSRSPRVSLVRAVLVVRALVDAVRDPPSTSRVLRCQSHIFQATSSLSVLCNYLPVMSAVESTKPAKYKGKDKEKEKDKRPKSGGGQKSQVERLKTVVRRLPPNLPEEIFWQSVAQWVNEETITWKAYYPGKFKTRYVLGVEMKIGRGEVAERAESD